MKTILNNSRPRVINMKMCLLVLRGAKGDLRQNSEGAFIYAPSDLPKECWSAALVRVSEDELVLTREGANFILENLFESCTRRDIATLQQFARP